MGLMKGIFIEWTVYVESLGDEPCEWDGGVYCPEEHCPKCMRHFTETNPQAKDDEIECFVCFESE